MFFRPKIVTAAVEHNEVVRDHHVVLDHLRFVGRDLAMKEKREFEPISACFSYDTDLTSTLLAHLQTRDFVIGIRPSNPSKIYKYIAICDE